MGFGRRAVAEFLGTSWLVLGGCGAATLSAKFPFTGIGFLGVALAFGLTLVSGIYALGAISGGHFNPAVTIGLATAGRFPVREVPVYVVAQVLGATVGALVLLAIASGAPGFDVASGRLAANGYGAHSPGGYSLAAAVVVEIVTTFMFVLIVLGSTDSTAHKPFAPLAIGLGLTLVHLVSIPVTNASVNPARSTGPAIIAGGWALEQLWLFWAAPLVAAVLAGWAYPALVGTARDDASERASRGSEEEERLRAERPAHAR